MTFAEKLKEIRKKYNYTQKQLSEKFEIPKRTIENWEGEKRLPPEYIQKIIIKYLNQEDALDHPVQLAPLEDQTQPAENVSEYQQN